MVENDRFVAFPFIRVFGYPEIKESIYLNQRRMSGLLARKGRHRQRYENNVRLVSGCIPYRLRKDLDHQPNEIENRIQVLMVSSPNRTDLVFPKGGWEDDETVLEAACREAIEEAGVRGILREIPLGVWQFRSKSSQDLCSLEGGCKGFMFALQVTEELESWPEQENHSRKWLSIKEAHELCRYQWMREALDNFVTVMAAEDKNIETSQEIVQLPNKLTVSEVVADCPLSASTCCVNSFNNGIISSTRLIVGAIHESRIKMST